MNTYRGDLLEHRGLTEVQGGLTGVRGGGLIEYLQGDLLEYGVVGDSTNHNVDG